MAKDVLTRKLRYGMVGGGPGSFIGGVHRRAAEMDGQAELVAGCFTRDAKKGLAFGRSLFVAPGRIYPTFQDMLNAERAKPATERLDFVIIATPNHMHFAPAKAFLEAGFHVILDKPMTFDAAEAKALAAVVKKTGKVFALTHNYTGYPMVKCARDLVKKGFCGKLRKVVAQYPQGWLYNFAEKGGANKQAAWRTDPKRSGAGGCLGDIGSHAENLARYVTGLELREICADLTTFVDGRLLDDDANILARWDKGVKGIIHASQISIGEENGLGLDVYGEKAGFSWRQEDPNRLWVKYPDKPTELWTRGGGQVAKASPAAARATRIPGGHPEGFIEAFANLYANAMETIRCAEAGQKPPALALDFPTVEDGVKGMQFIETAVKSAKAGAKWTKLPR